VRERDLTRATDADVIELPERDDDEIIAFILARA
jgi:hypothetical protein